jgi:hypothetical protein
VEDVREIKKALNHILTDTVLRANRIRDTRSYRDTHTTFDAFCHDTFDFGERRGRQLAAAGEVVRNLLGPPVAAAVINRNPGSGPPTPVMPTSERQVRPLVGLPKGEQREVWKEAVDASGGEVPSAKTIESIVEERKGPAVPDWPVPNGLGRYPEALAEKIEFKDCPDANAEVLVLQIGLHSWIAAGRYEYKGGSGPRSVNWPDLQAEKQFPSVESAVAAAARDVAEYQRDFLRQDRGTASELATARLVGKWANELLKSVAYAPVLMPKPPEFQARAEAAVDLAAEHKAAVAKRFNAPGSGLSFSDCEVIEKAKACAESVREILASVSALGEQMASERFGQARYFLECAKNELLRISKPGADWGKRGVAVEPAELPPVSERLPRAAYNKKIREIARKRWEVLKQLGKATDQYVICREVKDGKPKYWSGPMSWTIDPTKARHLPKVDAAARLKKTGNFGSCAGDRVMPLDKALRRFKKS